MSDEKEVTVTDETTQTTTHTEVPADAGEDEEE